MQIFCKVQNLFFREKKIIVVIKSISNSNNRCFQAKLRLLQKEFRNSAQYSLRNRVSHDNDDNDDNDDDDDYTNDLVIR